MTFYLLISSGFFKSLSAVSAGFWTHAVHDTTTPPPPAPSGADELRGLTPPPSPGIHTLSEPDGQQPRISVSKVTGRGVPSAAPPLRQGGSLTFDPAAARCFKIR